MNVTFQQKDRLGSLSTDLGRDVLNLLRFAGTDHMNGLFDFSVEALSADINIDFDQILGTHATVTIASEYGPRYFDGIVTETKWAGATDCGNKYALTLKPWFWLAGRRRNQRIFHNQTVVEIIEKLLAPYAALGKPALRVTLTDSYPTLEYTVQYRESDMAFAMRLMERFGISYHFSHDDGSHTMVLTDSNFSHARLPGQTRLFKPHDGSENVYEEHIWSWYANRRLTTGAMRLTDYNFKTPNAAMEVDRIGDAAYAEGQIESYDYPGDYLDQGRGKDVVGLRMDQERGHDRRQNAVGDCVSLGAGMLISMTGNAAPDGQYLCLSASHNFTAETYATGADSTDNGYTGTYVLMPDAAPLAPSRTTHIPVVQGPQTAVVVGEGEIDCDAYGRILVHFHWDLEKAYSMRCRVSQNWASKGWGGMVIPRIGMEVVVEFLEGNPDKPIVTGCVYNGKNDPPYPLPANKTKSVFRSDTHKGTGFNEFTFEDENGREKIYLHGQKDHEIHIENDRTKRIDRNQNESVGRNKNIEVGNNHHEVIGGNMTIMVGPNKLQSFVLGKFKALTSALGDMTSKLGLPEAFNMGEGNLIIGVAKNKAETVMVSSSEIVGGAKTIAVGGGFQVSVQGIKNESVLLGSYEEVGQNKVVVAGKRMEFVCGKSKIQLNENGDIIIEGVNIKATGSSTVDIDGGQVDVN